MIVIISEIISTFNNNHIIVKKAIIFFVISTTIFTSCDLFLNKNELLTRDIWIIQSNYISINNEGKSENKLVFYKKSEEMILLLFRNDGILKIKESNPERLTTSPWNWESEKKKVIKVNWRNNYSDFSIIELNETTLKISIMNNTTFDGEIMTFKHPSDTEWWNDEEVDQRNKISNN